MPNLPVPAKVVEEEIGPLEEVREFAYSLGMPAEGEDPIVFEVTPNRPDLLFVEGWKRAFRAWKTAECVYYRAEPSSLSLENTRPTSRPWVAAALVKEVTLTEESLSLLMLSQEKFHDSFGRRRKKVAVGLHDAKKVLGKIVYREASPTERMQPLDGEEASLREILLSHPKGKEFSHLARPPLVIEDEEGIFSFPPVINSERTRLRPGKTDILVESTGTTPDVAKAVLLFATALAERGGRIQTVRINGEFFPDFSVEEKTLDVQGINSLLGTDYSAEEVSQHLSRMGVKVNGRKALIPQYRFDLWETCDFAEEVAISVGYQNLIPEVPNLPSFGEVREESPVHEILVGAGFSEVFGTFLVSRDLLQRARAPLGERVLESKTSEAEYLRTALYPGLLRILAGRKTSGLPVKIYELGRIYVGEEKEHLAFAWMDSRTPFQEMRGVLQVVLKEIFGKYEVRIGEHPAGLPGRIAEFSYGDLRGHLFEVHPEVLLSFGITYPTVIFEGEFPWGGTF